MAANGSGWCRTVSEGFETASATVEAVPQLIALDLPAGDLFVEELQRVWERGDAAFPLDQRLPAARRTELLERMRPAAVVDETGTQAIDGGAGTEPGDALVVATSGTTGEPKGVVLTHDAVAASARITSSALGVDPAVDCWLACLPLAHIGGLSVVTRALLTGTRLIVHERFVAADFHEAAREGATLASLVVTALGRVDVSAFRTILLGGSAIPIDRPSNTVATYGMTETGSGVVYEGYALDEVQLRINNGVVEVKSPTLLRCYRDGSTPVSSDGWFATGDAGSLDEDGKLSVTGRIGDMIVSGGENIWPVVVERALERLEWVREVAVVGRPDAEWGQRTTAVVVPAPGHAAPELEAVRDALTDVLPRHALPRAIEIVDELPRTNSGKIRREAV